MSGFFEAGCLYWNALAVESDEILCDAGLAQGPCQDLFSGWPAGLSRVRILFGMGRLGWAMSVFFCEIQNKNPDMAK